MSVHLRKLALEAAQEEINLYTKSTSQCVIERKAKKLGFGATILRLISYSTLDKVPTLSDSYFFFLCKK